MEDVVAIAPYVLGHRLLLEDGMTPREAVQAALSAASV